MRSATGLYAILLLVWSSMMLGMYMIFGMVLPAQLPFDETLPGLAGTLKVALGVALAIFWLYVWKKLTDAYFRRVLRAREKERAVP